MELNKINQPEGLHQNSDKKPNSNSDTNNSKKIFFVVFTFAVLFIVVVLAISAKQTAKKEEKLAQEMDLSFLNTTTTISNGQNNTESATNSTQDVAVASKTIKKTVTKVTAKTPSTSLSATPSYVKAFNVYRTSGYYFQFVNCHGTPGSLTMKKGVKFMIDNHDSKTHKFLVLGKNFSLGAYGYTIITADRVGKYNILCDGGGAAQITIQP